MELGGLKVRNRGNNQYREEYARSLEVKGWKMRMEIIMLSIWGSR